MTNDTTAAVENTAGQDASVAWKDTEARIYEVGYLLLPTIPEADVPREVTALKDILDKGKATIIAEEFPKFRALAYPMQKRSGLTASHAQAGGAIQTHANGYFGWVKFEAEAAEAQRIEAELKLSPHLLRFLLVKTVRESTLATPRPPRAPRPPQAGREAPKSAPAPAPVSEVELDKSIERLIAE